MKISLTGNLKEPPYGIIFFMVFLMAGILLIVFYPFIPNYSKVCYFHEITSIPCPTCGSTRAILALVRGDIVSAFLFNPLFFVLILFISLWGGISLIF